MFACKEQNSLSLNSNGNRLIKVCDFFCLAINIVGFSSSSYFFSLSLSWFFVASFYSLLTKFIAGTAMITHSIILTEWYMPVFGVVHIKFHIENIARCVCSLNGNHCWICNIIARHGRFTMAANEKLRLIFKRFGGAPSQRHLLSDRESSNYHLSIKWISQVETANEPTPTLSSQKTNLYISIYMEGGFRWSVSLDGFALCFISEWIYMDSFVLDYSKQFAQSTVSMLTKGSIFIQK